MYRKSGSKWRCPLGLLSAHEVVRLPLAIDPDFRQDSLLEILIVIVARCIYSFVRYDEWWRSITGAEIDGRNRYDRFVHCARGAAASPSAAENFALPGTTLMLSALTATGRPPVRRKN